MLTPIRKPTLTRGRYAYHIYITLRLTCTEFQWMSETETAFETIQCEMDAMNDMPLSNELFQYYRFHFLIFVSWYNTAGRLGCVSLQWSKNGRHSSRLLHRISHFGLIFPISVWKKAARANLLLTPGSGRCSPLHMICL